MTSHDPIPARLAALRSTSTPDLNAQWRDLFDTEPPPFNRRFLESRLFSHADSSHAHISLMREMFPAFLHGLGTGSLHDRSTLFFDAG